ncbi:hypothetical protein [Marinilabilia rubra]|uniref:DUF5025 domain-containing protein n=1 Tax=Marinilabilia rubra TaxID=2162893 RepID=A0A2U2BEE5_9BACT|nr:hypothetical protein [Marinilabilia rubra]PWE01431.1 hypothetical protein DDZ16_02800 [Marinilabilia rubra]
MKKLIYSVALLGLLLAFSACEKNEMIEPEIPGNSSSLKSSNNGNMKLTGVDDWGFNWQAGHFDGFLINAILGDHMFMGMPHYKQAIYHGEGIEFWNNLVNQYPYIVYFMPASLLDCRVIMHWNEELVSKQGVYPATWLDANASISFKFMMNNGDENWSQFRKFVSVRSSDELINGIWYSEDGVEIGPYSYDWGTLVEIQTVSRGYIPEFFYEDMKSPNGPGYGKYKIK